MIALYEMLPTFVGSKKRWITHLQRFSGNSFVELFCGSAVISFNLASTALFNDADEFIYKIISRFDEQRVPPVFTQKDYFDIRPKHDWWKHAYCLQAMSFSGVFRHSSNGYNVPVKKNIEKVCLQERYAKALARWNELKPRVTNLDYWHIPLADLKDKVVVSDPPYFGSKASYNADSKWNRKLYWDYVGCATQVAKAVIVFDRIENLKSAGIPALSERTMRVNGKYKAGCEQMAVFENGEWSVP